MATKAQFMASALAHIEKSTISVDTWCSRVQDGYKGKEYDFMNTEIYKSLKDLEGAKHAVPVNPNPPPSDDSYLNVVRRGLYLTSDTSRALETKNRLLIATADRGYRQFYSSDFIRAAIAQDRFRVWCDCRPAGEGTPPEVALEWLRELGLPPSYFYGQCENPAEFDRAYNAGARKMVGNVDSLRDDQHNKLKSKEVLVSNEAYYNVNPGLQPDWHNCNAGIGGNCLAVYESAGEGAVYTSLRTQQQQGRYDPNTSSLYVADFREDDWNLAIST